MKSILFIRYILRRTQCYQLYPRARVCAKIEMISPGFASPTVESMSLDGPDSRVINTIKLRW